MKVYQFKNKNQFVIEGEGKTIFQSYDSTIAIIQNGELTLGIDWDYSNTTLKHLYLFLEEYYNMLELLKKSNKKAYIQKLINNGTIKYDNNLQ